MNNILHLVVYLSLVVLASESQVDAPLITCFHFFRLVVVIVTAPFILKYLSG